LKRNVEEELAEEKMKREKQLNLDRKGKPGSFSGSNYNLNGLYARYMKSA